MLRAFANAFRIPDLRGKILFTLFMVTLYRFGSYVPAPIIDIKIIQEALKSGGGGFITLVNMFSGRAFGNMAIFALGIMPYITSSIIMQLLTVVIPRLDQWKQEGESGQKKITQWTRYLTVSLAVLQSTGIAFFLHNPGANQSIGINADAWPPSSFTAANVGLFVLTMTAGTALIMWMGELITQRGIGNGMSILIFAGVIVSLPAQGEAFWAVGKGKFAFMMLLFLGVIIAVVIMEQGQRRIPVQYAKRVIGRKMTAGQSSYIPLKVNQAGVIPIIFASSLLYFPVIISQTLNWSWLTTFTSNFLNPAHWTYMATFGLMIVFFSYFYTAVVFNPVETADNIRKYGGFVPGIRPGQATAKYLNDVLTRITLPGSIFLAVIALIPSFFTSVWGISRTAVPLGGTSVLITVGVALETMKQVESQLLMRHYEGFLG